jgi:hypothetical protein
VDVQAQGDTPTVGANGAQGIQAGTDNVQINNWTHKPPLDLKALNQLSPHAAVARLQERSHGEVVDFFAGASPGDVAELLTAVISADDALAVAILAELRPECARGLLAPVPDRVAPWLDELPVAAEAIARHAVDIKWHRSGGAGRLERDGSMYFRRYAKGFIYWSAPEGAMEIGRAIVSVYRSADFGAPVSGDGATLQYFDKGAICLTEQGAIGITGGIYQKWYGMRIGFPIAVREDFSDHSSQRWEDGVIFESEHGSFYVRSDLAELEAGIPLEDEVEVTSPYGTKGFVQRFSWKLPDLAQEVLACSSECGAFSLSGHRPWQYQALGGPGSWMGFPVAEQERVRDGAWLQKYEGGILYYPDGNDPSAVQRATLDLIGESDGATILGWPVSEEEPIGTGPDRIQFFERGAVTLRDSERRILVYPESPALERHKSQTQKPGRAVPRSVPRAVPPSVPKATAAGALSGSEEGQFTGEWNTFPR